MTNSKHKSGYILNIDPWEKMLTLAEGNPGGTASETVKLELAYGRNQFKINDLVNWLEITLPSGKVIVKELTTR